MKSFWEVSKQYDVEIVINSDSHHPEKVWDSAMDEAYAFAADLGISCSEDQARKAEICQKP